MRGRRKRLEKGASYEKRWKFETPFDRSRKEAFLIDNPYQTTSEIAFDMMTI